MLHPPARAKALKILELQNYPELLNLFAVEIVTPRVHDFAAYFYKLLALIRRETFAIDFVRQASVHELSLIHI